VKTKTAEGERTLLGRFGEVLVEEGDDSKKDQIQGTRLDPPSYRGEVRYSLRPVGVNRTKR